MKRIICLITILCIIFSSFSFCFAAGWSDSQISSVVSDLSTVKTTLNNIYSRIGTIMNYLYDDSHSVAYWASAIASWMQPIYQALTNNLVSALDIEPIIAGLNEVVSSGGNTSYTPYLKYGGKSNANWLSDLYDFDKVNGFESFSSGTNVTWTSLQGNGTERQFSGSMANKNWRTNFGYALNTFENMVGRGFGYTNGYFNTTQNAVNWGNLGTSSFTPRSAIEGTYNWLSAIQAPVARLSYVLASEERIEAQEAAAANEEAVVDNFIDSNGSGAASTSDIGSISDLSSGYKSNFGSDASVTGIFNIFNSNNMGWFSSETYNQLDTTSNNRRAKSDYLPDTPLLDQKIDDIYNAIGLDNDR